MYGRTSDSTPNRSSRHLITEATNESIFMYIYLEIHIRIFLLAVVRADTRLYTTQGPLPEQMYGTRRSGPTRPLIYLLIAISNSSSRSRSRLSTRLRRMGISSMARRTAAGASGTGASSGKPGTTGACPFLHCTAVHIVNISCVSVPNLSFLSPALWFLKFFCWSILRNLSQSKVCRVVRMSTILVLSLQHPPS